MTLLDNHLEQITLSAWAIGDLEIFTNAILGRHEITTLIRDTEPHEKSLFTIDPHVAKNTSNDGTGKTTDAGLNVLSRRRTVGAVQPRQGSAVAKVLGTEMLQQIQQSSRGQGRARNIDVEVLLRGAEKLSTAYPVVGAKERISKVRTRHTEFARSILQYEGLLHKQQAKLNRIHSQRVYDNEHGDDQLEINEPEPTAALTEADLQAEEREIRELEVKKKALEDRVAGIEKDLGGLLR